VGRPNAGASGAGGDQLIAGRGSTRPLA
jgi:hypothetical protein